jgi:hypothetical protein
MTTWLSEDDKEYLINDLKSQFGSGLKTTDAVLKAKMELDALEVATRAAKASERNGKYMLASTIFAAASAVASFLSVFVPLFIKH